MASLPPTQGLVSMDVCRCPNRFPPAPHHLAPSRAQHRVEHSSHRRQTTAGPTIQKLHSPSLRPNSLGRAIHLATCGPRACLRRPVWKGPFVPACIHPLWGDRLLCLCDAMSPTDPTVLDGTQSFPSVKRRQSTHETCGRARNRSRTRRGATQ